MGAPDKLGVSVKGTTASGDVTTVEFSENYVGVSVINASGDDELLVTVGGVDPEDADEGGFYPDGVVVLPAAVCQQVLRSGEGGDTVVKLLSLNEDVDFVVTGVVQWGA